MTTFHRRIENAATTEGVDAGFGGVQPSVTPGAPHIFVIEDDHDLRELTTTALSYEGYDVRAWSNGFDALRAMDAGERPDLIVLDLMMPRMDGWQFRVEQRKRPLVADVPVLVASADASSKAAAVDADAFMMKPIDFAKMRSMVSQLLADAERRRLGAHLRENERLRSLGTLVAGVAHEINNPLTFVSGSLELAQRGFRTLTSAITSEQTPLSERVEKALADARVGTERIAAIVRALARFARVESDVPDTVDLHDVLDGAATLAAAALRARATLVKDYGSVPTILASEGRLGQVFVNLLVNAAQSIPEGGPSGMVKVTTGTTERGPFVEISDNGSGIPEELASRIFDPFFTTKAPGEGTGLGLSISRDIVNAHGGDLSMRSVVGKGTTFRVDLPFRALNSNASTQVEESVPTPGAQSGARERPQGAVPRARVLVVDDESMLCKLIARALAPHEVVATTSARDALASIRSGDADFDIVFCDLNMPGMDGATFYESVQEKHPDLAARFVFMSGAASTDAAHRFLTSTGCPVLQKPFSISALAPHVEARLERATQRPALQASR